MGIFRSTFFCAIILIILSTSQEIFADDNKALSTSGLVGISYKKFDGTVVKTCSEKKAVFSRSYVSIGVRKVTVNKSDSLIKRIFNKDRHAFVTASLNAKYNLQPLSISKVGHPILIKDRDSSVDMGVEWAMLENIPWLLKDASFNIKLGYSSDSVVKPLVEAFSGITSSIPDYTISTSLATGFAITNAVDTLLFGPGRALDLLRAQRDLPLLGSQLCEGFYAIFAAVNNEIYEKYYSGDVVWTGNDLEYQGLPINDVCYVVVSVKVSDRYYAAASDAVDDHSRLWSSKYRDILTGLFQFSYVSTKDKIEEITKGIVKDLLDASILLNADINLIQNEKNEIHSYVNSEFQAKLDLAHIRITPKNEITQESTELAITSALNGHTRFVDPLRVQMAERIALNPDQNIPEFDPDLASSLQSAIKNLNTVIGMR
jgi:hypothetical protein